MTQPENAASMGNVTDLDHRRVRVEQHADSAMLAADAAALNARVRIREITELSELDAIVRLFDAIWRRDTNPPVSTELLRAFAKAGNYVAGAFDGADLVGACVGFFSAPADEALHSHIAGVSAAVSGRSVGFALKLHQRAWALVRGIPVIAWTYDPLVSRNAYFNLAKLAAVPVEYLPNFYGGMRDIINGDDDSDRVLVHWRLTDPRVAAACVGELVAVTADDAPGAVVALGVSEFGRPVAGPLDGPVSLIAVPRDIESMRTSDPGLAKEWRAAVRTALCTLMADGAHVTGFDRRGSYIVRHEGSSA